jgi:hypothetical protein
MATVAVITPMVKYRWTLKNVIFLNEEQSSKQKMIQNRMMNLLKNLNQLKKSLWYLQMTSMRQRTVWPGKMIIVTIKTVLYGLIWVSVRITQTLCMQCAQNTAYPSHSTTQKTAKPGMTLNAVTSSADNLPSKADAPPTQIT